MPINPPDIYTSAEITVTPYSGPYTVGLAGVPVYVLAPLSYVDINDAIAWGKDFFSRTPVELYILSTNGVMRHNYENASQIMPSKWTILDAINSDTFDDATSTVGEVFDRERDTPEGVIIDYGNELADADYKLVVNGSVVTAVSIIGTDGKTSMPAPGKWVFRVGGVGPFDAAGANFRDYAGLSGNTEIEAQDQRQETPVISILFNRSKPSFVTRGFFGYPTFPGQVNEYGYVSVFPYGVKPSYGPINGHGFAPYPPYEDGLYWLPVVDGYPPFTTGPTILGPVIPQGEATNNVTYYDGSGMYTGVIAGFVPRPDDAAYNDTGTGAGRFLSGFRMRFNSIERTIQTTEQLIGYVEPIFNHDGYQIAAGYTTSKLSAPTVEQFKFKYADDITKRRLNTHPPNPFMPPSPKDYIFPFDDVFSIALDVVSDRNSGGNEGQTVFLDGSPLLTADPNAGPTKDDHVRMIPYVQGVVNPFAPAPNGPYYYQHTDDFVGWSSLVKQTQGTYWIKTEYAASTVYIVRDAAGGETYEYGDESLFSISMMVRRQEPPQAGIEKFTPSAATQLSDGFDFSTSGYSYFRNYEPIGVFVVSFPCDTPGHGFYIYEKWGGHNETQNFAFDQSGIGYYYPGFYHQVLAPTAPPAPQGWEQITTTPGNTFYPQVWGGSTDGEIVVHQVGTGTTYTFLQSLGTVGGTFLLRAYAIILPFEWGGSVPYSMPPPFATSLALMGQKSGDNLYGPSYWTSASVLPDVSTAQTEGRWQLNGPISKFNWPYNEGTGLVVAEASHANHLPEHNDPQGNPYSYTAAIGLNIDAFYGPYTPPVFPDPPIQPLYGIANGKIDVYFSDDGIDGALQGFYNGSVTITIADIRNRHNMAYWQDYGANIFADFPDKGAAALGTVADPPGKIVLGYDSRQTVPSEIKGVTAYLYLSPHFATGPIRMFVNADIDLSNGKGVRSGANNSDAPVFPPFVVLTPHSSQGPGIGVLQVECSDGTSRNVQVYLAPPRVRI